MSLVNNHNHAAIVAAQEAYSSCQCKTRDCALRCKHEFALHSALELGEDMYMREMGIPESEIQASKGTRDRL